MREIYTNVAACCVFLLCLFSDSISVLVDCIVYFLVVFICQSLLCTLSSIVHHYLNDVREYLDVIKCYMDIVYNTRRANDLHT